MAYAKCKRSYIAKALYNTIKVFMKIFLLFFFIYLLSILLLLLFFFFFLFTKIYLARAPYRDWIIW